MGVIPIPIYIPVDFDDVEVGPIAFILMIVAIILLAISIGSIAIAIITNDDSYGEFGLKVFGILLIELIITLIVWMLGL